MVGYSSAPPDYEPLKELVKHHIESFDHMVSYGLETMLVSISPVEVFDPFTKKKLRNILHFRFSHSLIHVLFGCSEIVGTKCKRL
ncbi:hypothetical protein ACSBR1_025198 [Camellia fascicularis]